MDLTADELAGVVDLFGGLTRPELGEALAELAFRHGEAYDDGAFESRIDGAIASYHLVAVESADVETATEDPVLVSGPVAFPELPQEAQDLPHILDIEHRNIAASSASQTVETRFRDEATSAIEDGNEDRARTLIDVSYELEAWGPLDLSEIRNRLLEVT